MTVSRVAFVNRRQGTMTTIYEELIRMCKARGIQMLVIQCVETQEMVNWCIKNGFASSPSNSMEVGGLILGDYFKKIN